MKTIISGADSTVSVSVLQDGQPVAITGDVTARVYNMTGTTEYIAPFTVDDTDSDYASGLVVITLLAADTALLPIGDVLLILSGSFGIKRFKLAVETMLEPVRTSLFIRDIVIDEMRTDRLVAAAAGALQDVTVSDDYIWQKVRAAESEIGHMLRVPLVPTKVFPVDPTQDEIDALNGMAWMVESSPDYEAEMFSHDRWGTVLTRQKPIIEVESVIFSYPTQTTSIFRVPDSWLRVDKKYGSIRILPTSNVAFTGMSGFFILSTTFGRTIPNMVQIRYTAGLTDVETNWPELLDAIKKMAVIKIIEDAYLPQSGSISSDGLSQSLSVDMDKYRSSVDAIMNGTSGNGGLVAAIHGVRMIAL